MFGNQIYRVILFGHRDFDGHKVLDESLYRLLKEVIASQPFVEIYIGRNGEFDVYAATIVKRVQNEAGKENNEFICVLPYNEKNTEYYEKYYDKVIIPECVEASHPKGAIVRRNRWMVLRADLFICYVERKSGGAYEALKYAERLGKKIVNLSELGSEK